jgi:hypothetical protein
MATMKNSIAFKLKPIGNEIAKVGEKGKDFLKSHGFSDDTVQMQIMVIKELIKSGKTFDNQRPSGNEMSVHIFIEENTIIAEVKKPVNETTHDNQLQKLDETIQWIRGYRDPYTPFMMIARKSSDNYNDSKSNSFGLAKIAYEAGAVLDFYVSEDNILNLSAVRHVSEDCKRC